MASARSLVFWLATLAVCAQTPPASVTFKSGTSLVEATAVVRDRQNKAVGGLTADDFELFDSGKQQEISRFEIKRLALPEKSTPAAKALPNHFVAFILDDQNLVPEHFLLATLAAIRHLADLHPGDRAAVRSTSGRINLPFTGDLEKLRQALSQMGSLGRRGTFDISGVLPEVRCQITYLKADWITNGDAASMRNCVAGPSLPSALPVVQRPGGSGAIGIPGEAHRIQTENQVRAFAESVVQAGDRDVLGYFNVVGDLLGAMSHMPGERTIILLSPGMYIAPRFRHLQDRLIAESVRSRVVISGVDPRGVYIRNDLDDPSTFMDTWGLAETRERNLFMDDVASGTGGNFIRGNNDILGALRKLDASPEYLYVLGFTPTELKLDGKYHPLKITLRHARGLTVDGRRGYYAADSELDAAAQLKQQINGIFFSNQEWDDLPVKLQIRSSHKPDSIVLTTIANIDINKLAFRKEGNANLAGLNLLVGLFDENGNFVKDFWKEIELHPDDAALPELRQSGIEVQTGFDVAPGRYLVRVLARDAEGRSMGTQRMVAEIRP